MPITADPSKKLVRVDLTRGSYMIGYTLAMDSGAARIMAALLNERADELDAANPDHTKGVQ
jgi:hypothetical protein